MFSLVSGVSSPVSWRLILGGVRLNPCVSSRLPVPCSSRARRAPRWACAYMVACRISSRCSAALCEIRRVWDRRHREAARQADRIPRDSRPDVSVEVAPGHRVGSLSRTRAHRRSVRARATVCRTTWRRLLATTHKPAARRSKSARTSTFPGVGFAKVTTTRRATRAQAPAKGTRR